eukprot:CAMPEP_0119379524 /NCGR_PEP_ID=MMETSP1334-20130426/53101_1 /TAXON_ID=127549 /ORGANISM="Calcidiscus leptoporus, Strain RCC1130" /LENGTH=288 /DNA_ID=CAMNT_0007399063 /DNA_START=92 /DNA_END=958 /DNA_ORIENTATION=-
MIDLDPDDDEDGIELLNKDTDALERLMQRRNIIRRKQKRARTSGSASERKEIEAEIDQVTEEIKGLVPPPPSDTRRLKTETGPSLRHPSPGGKDIGKKAWAYFPLDEQYTEVTLTAYYPKEMRRRSRCEYVNPSPWQKKDAERGCYRMDYLLDNEPWSKDYDMPSDNDETVIIWPIEAKDKPLEPPPVLPEAAYDHAPCAERRVVLHPSVKVEVETAAVPVWVERALALLPRGKISAADVRAEVQRAAVKNEETIDANGWDTLLELCGERRLDIPRERKDALQDGLGL